VYGSDMARDLGFSRLTISDWRQFHEIDLDLSSRLTIVTGENGAGKTSVLSALGNHFGFARNLVGTPSRVGNVFAFVAGRRKSRTEDNGFETFGELTYSSGATTKVGVWSHGVGPEFSIAFQTQSPVPGLFLDSHRIVSSYGRVENIPARFKSASEIMSEYRSQLFFWQGLNAQRKSPSLLMKESLVAAALYSEGNSAIIADPHAAEVWTGFQSVLRILLPQSLSFNRLMIDNAEVLVETDSGTFALEAASGGASAIFDLAWQIYLQSRESDSFTVCLDEPENHLHPSLQRSILPKLLDAFPKVKFIVATHSPFVVTSSRDARVHVLRRNAQGRVYSEKLDLKHQALTADEVLRDVLGVGSTLPLWAESEFDIIMAEFADKPLTTDALQFLATRLRGAGLRFSVPEVADTVARTETEGS